MKILWFPSNLLALQKKTFISEALARNVRPGGTPPRWTQAASWPLTSEARHRCLTGLRPPWRWAWHRHGRRGVHSPGTHFCEASGGHDRAVFFSKQVGTSNAWRHQIKWLPNQNSNFAKGSLPVGEWWFLTCDHSEWTPCKSKTTKIIVFWKCWLQIPTKRMVSFSFKTMKLIANLELQGTVWKRDQPTLRSSWIIPVNLHDPQILT